MNQEISVKLETHGIDELREDCKKLSNLIDEINDLINKMNETKITITAYSNPDSKEKNDDN